MCQENQVLTEVIKERHAERCCQIVHLKFQKFVAGFLNQHQFSLQRVDLAITSNLNFCPPKNVKKKSLKCLVWVQIKLSASVGNTDYLPKNINHCLAGTPIRMHSNQIKPQKPIGVENEH